MKPSLPLLALSLLLAGCNAPPSPSDTSDTKATTEEVVMDPKAPQLQALSVEPVAEQRPTSVPLAGRLIWNENATVRVFTPFAGIVRTLFVEVNQAVTKGMPLAEIQSADFGQAQADARKAANDFRRADRNLDRLRDLAAYGAAPRKDLESAEADLVGAQAELDRANARLAVYGASAASTNQVFRLPSPLDGILVERNLTPGQEVRPDQMLANLPQYTQPLFVVTDPARLWIQIDATEAELPFLRPGCEFAFHSHAFPNQTFTGRVETVSEFIDPSTRAIKVRGSVDNSRRLLKAEMFVSVDLPEQLAAGATVPAKAVFLNGDKHYVFLAEEPGKFSRHEVQIGPEQDGRILVLAGVHPGDQVVTEGCLLLQRALK